jgi:hypothetical protein
MKKKNQFLFQINHNQTQKGKIFFNTQLKSYFSVICLAGCADIIHGKSCEIIIPDSWRHFFEKNKACNLVFERSTLHRNVQYNTVCETGSFPPALGEEVCRYGGVLKVCKTK